MARDLTPLYPFTVRVQDGREFSHYCDSARKAIYQTEMEMLRAKKPPTPIVLVIRADEPFNRHPSRLRRLLDWIES